MFCWPYYLCFVLSEYKIIVLEYMTLKTRGGASGINSEYLEVPPGETPEKNQYYGLIVSFQI